MNIFVVLSYSILFWRRQAVKWICVWINILRKWQIFNHCLFHSCHLLRYCRRVLANMTTTYLTFWMYDNYLGNTEWKEYETSLPPSHNHQVRDGANVHFLTGSVALQIAVVCMKDASLSATLQAFVKLWKIQHELLQQVGIFQVNYRWPKQSQRVFWCSTIVTGDCN